jgi:hypothetical protein
LKSPIHAAKVRTTFGLFKWLLIALALFAAACQPNADPTATPSLSAPTGAQTAATPAADAPAPTPVVPTNVPSTPTGDPAAAESVERYLTAKVAGDRDALRDLLCSELEAQLDREALSFSGVEATIENMDCATSPDSATVSCTGEIIAVYDGENRPIALGSYRVVAEDGMWRWCGEAS